MVFLRLGFPAVTMRPIEDHERPHLAAFGAELRRLRHAAGLTQLQVAIKADLSEMMIRYLEHGQRRTRPSTIHRLAAAVAPDDVDTVAHRLLELAGPAVAPESRYAERQAKWRLRRRRSWERAVAEWEEQDRWMRP